MASKVDVCKSIRELFANASVKESMDTYNALFTQLAKSTDMKLTPYEMDTAINLMVRELIILRNNLNIKDPTE